MVITAGKSYSPFHLCILYPSIWASWARIKDSSWLLSMNLLTAFTLEINRGGIRVPKDIGTLPHLILLVGVFLFALVIIYWVRPEDIAEKSGSWGLLETVELVDVIQLGRLERLLGLLL